MAPFVGAMPKFRVDLPARRLLWRSGWISAEHDIIRGRGHEGFAVEGMKAETAVIAFDLEGIVVSSATACSSGKVQPSHVLAAMEISPAFVRGAA